MKKEIRKEYREKRKNIKNKTFKDDIIFKKIILDNEINEADTLLIYVSTDEEIETKKIINYFLKTKKVAVPRIENNEMNFYYIKNINELEKGYYNILEPITNNKVTDFNNSVCITPGICYSKDFFRVGYGGGFYDKFYAKNNIFSIGVCYKELLLNEINHDEFDILVKKLITD